MLVEGEGLDQWYIPFFVVLGLVLVGVGVGLFLSLRSRYKLCNKHYVEHFNPLCSPDGEAEEDAQSTKSVKSARVSAVVEVLI